ncbi:hypothetical protein B0O80DRAFT_497188 [Mortierella sp. GBAus27b]|nr:hypothetical protein BGX31_002609 [Mortierella sp. GBA43]KAI8356486.1 hypothetical protein B0O80DRAFT_497188 [Mortierella sp. GBAus27b]
MNPSSPYMFLPFTTPPSQVTSPVPQTHQTLSTSQQQSAQQSTQQQQQPLSPQQQQQLGPVTSQSSQDLSQELSSASPLSMHPTLQTSSSAVSVSSASPISVSGTLSSTVPSLSGHGHPTINTAILSQYGGMLPSPQSSLVPSTPTPGALLSATPPQSADLDSILATYADQPDLLKLIIASKTEEDRRWAEEARLKMLDLIVQGEGRGLLMTGYESLLNQSVPGTPTATGASASNISTPTTNIASTPVTSAPATTATAAASATTTTSLGLTQSGKRFMDDGLDSYSGTGNGTGNSNGPFGNFGQGLARKRSAAFMRDVPHGHLRSQSMSSMPSATSSSSLTPTSDQFNLSMMGLQGSSALQQPQHPHQPQQQQHPHSQHPHTPLHPLPPLTLQHSYQQSSQHSHFQSPVPHPMQQSPHQQLPPQFGQYPPAFPYHGMSQFHSQGIRRTNSLSHIPHFSSPIRPRNDTFRPTDVDSEEDSDDDYNNHVIGIDSRPGSSLSMNNMMGGNNETPLQYDFSDMTSLSPSGPNNSAGSILPSIHGTGSVVPMSLQTVGASGTGVRAAGTTAGSGAGASAGSSGAGAAGVDQKRKRKRREMQPVSKTIDSPEPFVDNYLWKNNGNTTQKKTGCKSIYYKCSNSAGGCTVNKTVTEKEGGGFTTKYRGEHLEDCNKFKRPQLPQTAHVAHSFAQSG